LEKNFVGMNCPRICGIGRAGSRRSRKLKSDSNSARQSRTKRRVARQTMGSGTAKQEEPTRGDLEFRRIERKRTSPTRIAAS
jgi:hypothetical protein